ncbi:hypothetical protein SAMN05421874_12275 [Nonomuraea maritima]|uniref:Uncharacterized protein n=1 Tax=Nonomuraea maritima TaxID=683260 RepID=A0A1G9KEV1_9ACTN|nr:hypothetical protein [Nonomuraea maritima]SDL48169.1 hypothetical protein SAMN05421874_12275 [Nonomuraea maritima]
MASTSLRTAITPTSAVRLGLLALTAIGIAGAALELAFERHWQTFTQLIPWVALGVLVVALALVAFGPARTAAVVRVLAGVVLLASAYGVFMHVSVNHGMGGMIPDWDTLSPLTQWWYALTKSVGAAPPLAPGMLAQSALLLLLATLVPRRRLHEVKA